MTQNENDAHNIHSSRIDNSMKYADKVAIYRKAAEQGDVDAHFTFNGFKNFLKMINPELYNNLVNGKDKAIKSAAHALFGGGDIGTDKDCMPEGYGEFGLEMTNPIPTSSIMGSLTYLNRLRTTDGKKTTSERRGSTNADNIPSMIDAYGIFSNDKIIAVLYICPYNKKNSEKAPRGFALA